MKTHIKNISNKTRHSFSVSIVPVLFFEFIFNLGLLLLIKPVFKAFIKILLALSGQTILLNEQIKNYIFSAVGIISLLLIFFIAVMIIFYEFSVIFKLIDESNRHQTIHFRNILKDAAYSLKRLLDPRFLVLGFYFILLIPVLGLGVNSSLIPQLFIPNFITDEVYKHTGGQAFIISLGLIAVLLFVRFLFSLPFMVLKDQSIKDASHASKKVTKGKLYQLSFIIFLIIITWTAIAGLPLLIARQFTSMIAVSISLFLTVIYAITSLSLSPLILNFVYVTFREGQNDAVVKSKSKLDFAVIKTQFYHYSKALKTYILNHKWMALIIVPLLLINMLPMTQNSVHYVPSQAPLVIGHRGSLIGVENTVEAVNAAYDQGAQYAEIDILLSKDNVPMVIHDNNLKRLTGKNQSIAKHTQAEIEALTIKSNGYTGKIIALDKFVEQINPNIKLLIELKSHGKETESIIDQTMQALSGLNTEGYLFQTAEFDLLLEINEKYPRLDLGYIIIGKLGWLSTDVIATIPADFLVFEESLVNQKLVDNVHSTNKAVFAWTVNKADTVKTLYELGVDGIISDYPEMVRTLRDQHLEN